VSETQGELNKELYGMGKSWMNDVRIVKSRTGGILWRAGRDEDYRQGKAELERNDLSSPIKPPNPKFLYSLFYFFTIERVSKMIDSNLL
jgi:hypothetical protein